MVIKNRGKTFIAITIKVITQDFGFTECHLINKWISDVWMGNEWHNK